MNKAIANAKTNGLRRRRRPRVRTSNRSRDETLTSVSASQISNSNDGDNDNDSSSSFHETLKQAQPYLVALIAVATVIRCVRRGRFR